MEGISAKDLFIVAFAFLPWSTCFDEVIAAEAQEKIAQFVRISFAMHTACASEKCETVLFDMPFSTDRLERRTKAGGSSSGGVSVATVMY